MSTTNILSVQPGTHTSSLGKAAGDAFVAGSTGVATLAVRDDALTALGVPDGDYAPLRLDSTGALHVSIAGSTGPGSVVSNAGTFAVQEDGAALTALQALSATASGSELQVDIVSSALPSGAATEASLATVAGAVSGSEMQCDVVSSALPTGAATEASLATVAGAVSGSEMQCDVLSSALPTGAATEASLATVAGAVSGTEMQCDVLSSALPTGAATEASLATVAGAVSGTEMQCDVLSSALPTGAATEASLATVAGAVSGTEMQCDVLSSALPTGAATEASLATVAGAVSGTEMQCDVLSSALPTGAATEASLATVAGAVSGSEMQCDVVSSALPTGAATEASLATVAGAVSGTEMQCDIVGALPAGTNAIGKLASNVGVDIGNIGSVGAVTPGTGAAQLGKAVDAAAGASDTGVCVLAVRDDALTTIAPAEGDYAQVLCDARGAIHTSVSTAPRGAQGNLMNAVAVSANDTASSTVDVTEFKQSSLLIIGSDAAAVNGYDCWVSLDSGTTWLFSQSVFPQTTDALGNTLADRHAHLALDLTGITHLKIHAHDTETVTASIVG